MMADLLWGPYQCTQFPRTASSKRVRVKRCHPVAGRVEIRIWHVPPAAASSMLYVIVNDTMRLGVIENVLVR
jgi:hypothetical protein